MRPTPLALDASYGDGTFVDDAASARLNVSRYWLGLNFDHYVNHGDDYVSDLIATLSDNKASQPLIHSIG